MGYRFRQWKAKRERKRKILMVIKADVEQTTKTTEFDDGFYHTELRCPCSRIHVLVHYQPVLEQE